MRFKFTHLFAVAAVALFSTQCLACQSGSRSSAPAAASGSFGGTSASPSFSPPQNYVAPEINQPLVNNFQGSQPVIMGSPQGMPLSQPSGSATRSPANMSMSQTGQAPVRASNSPGIPDSSLVDPVFGVSDSNSSYTVDHSAWNYFLSTYLVTDVQGINRIRYGSVAGQDRVALKNYLRALQSVDTRTLNRNEQLAFWFNLYNARTVDIVLDNYPIRSIRQIKEKFTDFVGPFDDAGAVNVMGKSLSLNDIESGIVRPGWNDPRIHYALNCASFGCPNLSPTAWTAEDLDGRLNGAAHQYINSGRGVKRGLFGVRAAKIYKWYKDDFGGTDEAVLNHMRQHADGNTLKMLSGKQKIAGYFYDWSLNDGKILRRRLLEPLIR